MTDYKVQLERLKRHYRSSVEHYDVISFLDLVHTLRVWTEVKSSIDQLGVKNFKKGILTKKVKRILIGSEYAYAYLPDGVTTYASATKEIDGRSIVDGPSNGSFSLAALIKIENNGDLSISQFLMVYQALSDEKVMILNNESNNVPIETVAFSKYMESSAIHFQFSGHDPNHISNEELIKRIANEYEASHANSSDTNFEINNVFSNPVKNLMEYKCAQLPLPYFVLLHIAKNIITNLEGCF